MFARISAAALALGLAAAPALAQDVDLTGVSHIDLEGQFRVEVEIGGAPSLRIEGDAEDVEKIRVRVRDDELQLESKARRFLIFGDLRVDATAYITLPELGSIEVARGVSAKAEGVESDTLFIEASTGASLNIAGTCGTLTADVSTGGDINGRDLLCVHVRADASTGGEADLHATESAHGEASTGGDINIRGGATDVERSTSTGGDVSIN